jgi:predicted ATPase
MAIAARLEDRFALLTSGARNVPARHQTLHAAIAWSYDLLEPSDQALFRRLAVFVGGCTLEAAGAVCPEGDDRQRDILDGLAALVDRSLLSLTPTQDGTPRFRMLESLREFALEQLAESDEAGEMQRRHAGFFLRFAERAKSGLLGPEEQRWLEHFDVEDDNLRAALAWTLGGGDPETGLKLAGALSPFWYSRGHLSEGRAWLDRALAHTRGVAVAARCQYSGTRPGWRASMAT